MSVGPTVENIPYREFLITLIKDAGLWGWIITQGPGKNGAQSMPPTFRRRSLALADAKRTVDQLHP
jgi:hypothetical protein